ncbi:MAG: CPBP family glutamic-type intramembrane protease [Planctomycetota bacterium]|nr:CPBP family glutamic-type intramembrane protease [Planctomycetota bacterium]
MDQHSVRTPDPGNRTWARWAWVASTVLVLLVIGLNQAEHYLSPPAPQTPAAEVTPPGLDPGSMAARLWVKFANALPMQASDRVTAMQQVDQSAKTPVDMFRAAVAAGEIQGEEKALERLDQLDEQIGEGHEAHLAPEGLAEDIEQARRVYAEGAAALDDTARQRLLDRHGWFARLLLVHDEPASSAARADVVGGGLLLIAVLGGFGLAAVCAMLLGLVLFIIAIVRLSNGQVRRAFVPPAPGGSVYLEMLAVFVGAFLVFKVGMGVVVSLVAGAGDPPAWAMTAALAGQWLLLLVPLYPLLRGVTWREHATLIGWHSGQGVLREIGAGVVGYLAGLPLLGAALVVSMVVVIVRQFIAGPDAEPPKNPIVEIIGGAGTAQLVLLFLLATVWAPLAEELVFRGALYRHLRSRVGVLVAAAVSALVFGVMHGYDVLLLMPVITIGFVFALMREWRGSLIGPIVAHSLHNATIMTLVLVVFGQLTD